MKNLTMPIATVPREEAKKHKFSREFRVLIHGEGKDGPEPCPKCGEYTVTRLQVNTYEEYVASPTIAPKMVYALKNERQIGLKCNLCGWWRR